MNFKIHRKLVEANNQALALIESAGSQQAETFTELLEVDERERGTLLSHSRMKQENMNRYRGSSILTVVIRRKF